ncbi:hypothetical protein ABB37_01631 [Leptomonas pyrrhocoris]|uniref:Uncharacterized protein n=1 Tax=Leptomonas pyrrhocoris TaxID=157538 RepID=A0A0N1J5D4_LEPPY|nr:hypothetical protein ABB37_01631 [Leptomonas pyrrhocoris]KPA85294.1 hypothetical protein ABB37_01631 [Leptomonas pyrrhocoris]|eukprot:XP_015663733.1 hypothetical protein ABB37_01631 [Leptomonas pyrrhocoris]
MSSLAQPAPGDITIEDLKKLTTHPHVSSKNPEDVVASRYLQRLGNTLVRRTRQALMERDTLSSPASFSKTRYASSRPTSALASSLAAIPDVPPAAPYALQQQQHTRGEDGASATRRWRSQVPLLKDDMAASTSTTPPVLCPSELTPAPFTRASSGVAVRAASSPRLTPDMSPQFEGRRAAPQDAKQASKPHRRRLSSQSAEQSVTSTGTNASDRSRERIKSYAPGGQLSHDDTRTASSTKMGAKRAERSRTPRGGIVSHSQLHTPASKYYEGTTDAYKEAVFRANAAVNHATALMASGAPPARKLRTAEERSALVLAQEHAKLMLLVGRRANLEDEIEDALELAEAYELDKSLRTRRSSTASTATTATLSRGAATPLRNARTPRKRRGSEHSKADVDVQLSIEPGAVRRRMRQLLSNLFGNGVFGSTGGGTTLSSDNLTRLVQQLQAQLDSVEGELANRFESDEDEFEKSDTNFTTMFEGTRRMRSSSTAYNSSAAMLAARPTLKPLQRRKRVQQKKQADLREVSSNQERMEWLMESVDAELLTDVTAEQYATDVAESPFSDPLLPAALQDNARMMAACKSILQAMRNKSDAADGGTAPAPAFSPKSRDLDTTVDSVLSPSYTGTVSQPSLVPFSLSGTILGDGTSTMQSGSAQDRAKGDSDGGLSSPVYGLKLLGFMIDVLAQYELDLEGETGNRRRKKRPCTAPSKSASFMSRPLLYRDAFSKDDEDDDLDSGEEDGGRHGGGSDGVSSSRSARERSGEVPGQASSAPHDTVGKRQPAFVDNTEPHHPRSNADGTAASASAATGAAASSTGKGATLLGAQLRNLRAGLLQDLHELCTLYDYMHLIDERRRELAQGAEEPVNNDYEAELERKLEEHRIQQEAAQRARDEAQRRKAEGAELDDFGRIGSAGMARRGQGRPSQASLRSQYGAGRSLPLQDGVRTDASGKPGASASLLAAERRRDREVGKETLAVEETTAPDVAEVETELIRECVGDGALCYTLVGFSAPTCTPGVGNAEAEDKPTRVKKKRGGAGSSSGAAENFLRYELRVQRSAAARPSSTNAGENVDPAAIVAVVRLNPQRLLNLRLAPAAGASFVAKSKFSQVTAAVEWGAPPTALLSFVPVKRYKAASFAKAFEFGASVETTQETDDLRETSVASMPFTFPSPGDVRPRSASLDSGAVLPQSESEGSLTNSAGEFPARDSRTKAGGESRSKPGSAAVLPRDTSQVDNETIDSAAADGETATRASVVPTKSKDARKTVEGRATSLPKKKPSGDLSASANAAMSSSAEELTKSGRLPPIQNQKAPASGSSTRPLAPPRTSAAEVTSPAGVHPVNAPSRTSSSAQQPLPSTPPMQETPRPVEEWGVPHSHAEMEAVEKNAVVLTVLSGAAAEGEQLARTSSRPSKGRLPTSRGGSGAAKAEGIDDGSTVSPAEALLAIVPDEKSTSVGGATASGVRVGSGGAGTEKGGRQSSTPSTAAAIDAVASELLRQVMEAEGGEGYATEEGASAGATSPTAPVKPAAPASIVDQDAAGLTQKQQNDDLNMSVTQKRPDTPLRGTAETSGKETGIRSDMAGSPRVGRPNSSPLTRRQAPHVSRPQTVGGRRQADGRVLEGLPSKSAEPPKAVIGIKAPPSLTITSSQSPPMRAEEAHQYGGCLVRLDIFPQEVDATRQSDSTAVTTAEDTAAPLIPPRTTTPPTAEPPLRAQLSRPTTATRPVSSRTADSAHDHPSTPTAAESFVPSLPPVLVKQTAGSSKVQVLLPQEAVTSSLGPRVRPATTSGAVPPNRQTSALEGVTSPPDATTTATNNLAATERSIAKQFSVLPKTGAAGEAAADQRTVTHVQTFLQAVMTRPESRRTGAAGGKSLTAFAGASKQSEALQSKSAAGRGGVSTLRSEVEMLQEEARLLFLSDPVRYDAVVSELMQQATEELQRELAPDGQRGISGDALAPMSVRSSGSGALSLPPVLVAAHPHGQAAGTSDEAEAALGNLSSAIPHAHVRSTPGTTRHSSSTSFVFGAFGTAPSSGTTQGRVPSFPSPQTFAGRRSTHALVAQSGSNLNSVAAAQRKSCADAVAEVERILYEQMKAKLLLRAIIEKMQALWRAKQRSAEEKNRGRVVQRMREVMDRALAASWPIERQRVIHLRKLICILDRRVGRVHGWLPHYSDANVLMTTQPSAMARSVLSKSGTSGSGTLTAGPLSTWYRKTHTADRAGVEDDSADGTCADACPRYMQYLPQRRMYHYVRLAKARRLMPLRLVRAEIHECHSRHILLGYERMPLETEEEEAAHTQAGWPKRDLPPHARLAKQRRGEFVPDRYDDMKSRGERERYRRRLQGTAAFQGVSKMFSPRTRQDAELPYALH